MQADGGMEAVRTATRKGDLERLKALVLLGAPVNGGNQHGTTALHWAVQKNFLLCAKVLIDARAQLQVADGSGQTPLHKAAKMGRANSVLLLLNGGALVDVMDTHGHTPLMLALVEYHCSRSLDRISMERCIFHMIEAGASLKRLKEHHAFIRYVEVGFAKRAQQSQSKHRRCRMASAAVLLVFKKKRFRDLAVSTALLVWATRTAQQWVDASDNATLGEEIPTRKCGDCGATADCIFLRCGHATFCQRCSQKRDRCLCELNK